jgi:hypothetical protein
MSANLLDVRYVYKMWGTSQHSAVAITRKVTV